MKKILIFSANIKLSLENRTGIMKKVFAQAKVFESEFDVYTWGYGDNEILFFHDGKKEVVARFGDKKERRRLYFVKLAEFAASSGACAFYYRYSTADFYLLKLLKTLKKSGVACVIEIPSYPYKGEFMDSLRKRMIYALDSLLRGSLKKYVDRVVIFLEEPKSIYGIECINTTNGIDCSQIPACVSAPTDRLRLIAVASMLIHHGFDRLIEGMKNYYASGGVPVQVDFMVVGSGPELARYKDLVEKYSLSDHVEFFGQKTGKDLDGLFDGADVAVGSLGLHRIGLTLGSTLKSREYLVRGVPTVYSTYDQLLKDDPYALEIPSDESPVDVNALVGFWNRLKDLPDLHKTIRESALNRCDMKITMAPVCEFFTKQTQDEV